MGGFSSEMTRSEANDIPSGYDQHSHGKIHPFLIGQPR